MDSHHFFGKACLRGIGDVEVEKQLPPGGVLQILREWAVKEDAPQISQRELSDRH